MIGIWVAGGALAVTSTGLCGLIAYEWVRERFGPGEDGDGW